MRPSRSVGILPSFEPVFCIFAHSSRPMTNSRLLMLKTPASAPFAAVCSTVLRVQGKSTIGPDVALRWAVANGHSRVGGRIQVYLSTGDGVVVALHEQLQTLVETVRRFDFFPHQRQHRPYTRALPALWPVARRRASAGSATAARLSVQGCLPGGKNLGFRTSADVDRVKSHGACAAVCKVKRQRFAHRAKGNLIPWNV